MKKLHAWAAIGYDFKSPLVLYNILSNTNGEMTLEVYRDNILESIIIP